MSQRIIISEEDYKNSIYNTKEWEQQTVKLIRWEHDYEKHQYVIDFEERNDDDKGIRTI